MSLFEIWVNKKYHDPSKLAKQYKSAKPYPHISLEGFLVEAKAKQLRQALLTEQFFEKESDLFKLSQTNELMHATNPVIKEFRALLASPEFSQYMQRISGVKLTNKELDMGGSMYKDTDFLLCHDDRVTGRKIAYILYLNPTFKPKEGGALALFNSKGKHPGAVVKRYSPSWNTFNFFTVSQKSWHSVEEVTTKNVRISINGWFH
jgi:prolyl 3-hydroxylase /prolyl 3,4-dihydroxylase